jgi:hypothetical protein
MRKPAISTLQSRIESVMLAEELKLPNKVTHVLRASSLTTLVAGKIPRDRAKMILGHSVLGGVTEKYLLREELLRLIEPTDRSQLRSLPTPGAVRSKALEMIELAKQNKP